MVPGGRENVPFTVSTNLRSSLPSDNLEVKNSTEFRNGRDIGTATIILSKLMHKVYKPSCLRLSAD